ncbi:hypothetical protein EON65_58910, partial [archaeon]
MDDDEEFLVTNLDDGETYRVGELAEKFQVVNIEDANPDEDFLSDAKAREGEEEEEDDKLFDAKQSNLSLQS